MCPYIKSVVFFYLKVIARAFTYSITNFQGVTGKALKIEVNKTSQVRCYVNILSNVFLYLLVDIILTICGKKFVISTTSAWLSNLHR